MALSLPAAVTGGNWPLQWQWPRRWRGWRDFRYAPTVGSGGINRQYLSPVTSGYIPGWDQGPDEILELNKVPC